MTSLAAVLRRRLRIRLGFAFAMIGVPVGMMACGVGAKGSDVPVPTDTPDGGTTTQDPGPTTSDATSPDGGDTDTCQAASEGSSVSLSCPAGQVITSVDFASYGTPEGACGALRRGSCHAFASEREVENRCLDRASCTVPASSRIFYAACPGTPSSLRVSVTCGAPVLRPFYRMTPVVGPFLENGVGLARIPTYLTQSDFPYHPRAGGAELPFANGATVVRLLGGSGSQGAERRDLDLVTRDPGGALVFHGDRLRAKLAPYLAAGYRGRDLTLVLDNVPWDLTAVPVYDTYGNKGVPGLAADGTYDPTQWGNFIERLAVELNDVFGEEEANFLRFRVGTEYRFSGTQDQYLTHYDYASAAIRNVLPGAHVGGPNAASVSIAGLDSAPISAYAVAQHAATEPNRRSGQADGRFDFFAASRYVRFGTDHDASVKGLVGACRELAARTPSLAHVPCEVHEWGAQGWNAVNTKTTPASIAYWGTMEPGPWGSAQLLHQLIRYQQQGVRVWHWDVGDPYRDAAGKLQDLYTGSAFVYGVLDAMLGGEPFTAQATVYPSPLGVKYLGLGSRLANRTIFLFTSSTTEERDYELQESVTFRLPRRFVDGRANLSFVRLDRASSAHQQLRDDLYAADSLLDVTTVDTTYAPFVSHPGRLGGIREMEVRSSPSDTTVERTLISPHRSTYEGLFVGALTRKPLDANAVTFDGTDAVVTVTASSPAVTAIIFEP